MFSKPMLKRYGLISLSMLLDILIYIISLIIALTLRIVAINNYLQLNIPFLLISSIVLIVTFSLFGIYQRIWSKTSGHHVVLIIRAVATTFVVMLILNLVITPRPVSLSVLMSSYFIALTGFVVVRYRSRLIWGVRWRYRAIWLHDFPDIERTLIIGAGTSGRSTALRLREKRADIHYRIIGFLDDDINKIGMIIENAEVLGTMLDVMDIVESHRVDLIVVAIHKIDGPNFRRILNLCERTSARIKVVPDLLKVLERRTDATPLRNVTAEDLIGRSIVTKHKDIDLSSIMNRRVLVTGAAGSIGSEITLQILDYEPEQLLILDNNESALHDLHISIKRLYPDIEIIPCLVDVSDYDSLHEIFEHYKPQLLFHAAAYKHVPMLELYPQEAIRVNVGGTMNVVELATCFNVERFVLISSDKAVDPSSIMGASKRICELLVHAAAQNDLNVHQTHFAVVRFGNVLGSRGSVVPTFNRQIDHGGPITITDPQMTRYFMSISEATNLVIHAAAMTTGDDVFVLRMGEVVKIQELAERMIRLRGLRPYIDIDIEYIGVRPGEKLHEELYEFNENPQSTQHPYITRIDGIQLNGHSHHFMVRIRNLVKDGFQGDNQPLAELKGIIAIDEPISH